MKRTKSTEKKTTKQSGKQLQQQATQIANEIFALMNQYTHDSATAKFFLNDEISKSMYVTAGSFASVVYAPQLEIEEIADSKILPLFLILITYGFQIYIKERSVKTNAAPYRLPTNEVFIRDASTAVLIEATNGNIIATSLAETIIAVILEQLQTTIKLDEYMLDKYEMDEQRVYDYMTIALYYGYNLAAILLNKTKK
jgi:hypothetical protein